MAVSQGKVAKLKHWSRALCHFVGSLLPHASSSLSQKIWNMYMTYFKNYFNILSMVLPYQCINFISMGRAQKGYLAAFRSGLYRVIQNFAEMGQAPVKLNISPSNTINLKWENQILAYESLQLLQNRFFHNRDFQNFMLHPLMFSIIVRQLDMVKS